MNALHDILNVRLAEIGCFDAVLYSAGALLVLIALRTVLVVLARLCGLYHPNFYRYFPHFPWRVFYLGFMSVKGWWERCFSFGKRSTGGFADLLSVFAIQFRPGKLLLGRAYGLGIGLLQPIGVRIQRHAFFYAMTGTAKTTSIITMLSTWTGSAFVIDPKAQIVNAIAEKDWREWFVFDPYGISTVTSASYNVFDCLKAAVARDGDQAAVLWALRIAESLIVTPPGSRSPYFFDVSRQFLSALILHVLTAHPESEHNLCTMRDLIVRGYVVYDDDGAVISTPEESHALLMRMMSQNTAFEGAIAGGAAAMASAGGETGGNVRSTLQDQTKSLDIPQVRNVLRETSIPLSDLKTRDDNVFALTAPIYSIREELSPLCRLLTNMTAYTFEAVKEKKGQCLTIIDELPSQNQGDDSVIVTILAVARSMGITFFGIAQNIELMKKCFPKSWKSFSGEADVVLWAGGNHPDNAAHLSEHLGKRTIIEKDPATGRKTRREVPVMDPDQVRRFLDPDSGHLIVTRAGHRSLKLMSELYFKALPVWSYVPDPDHKETILRRIARRLFDRAPRAAAMTSNPNIDSNP